MVVHYSREVGGFDVLGTMNKCVMDSLQKNFDAKILWGRSPQWFILIRLKNYTKKTSLYLLKASSQKQNEDLRSVLKRKDLSIH